MASNYRETITQARYGNKGALELIFNGQTHINEQVIAKDVPSTPPQLRLREQSSMHDAYTAVCVDIDAPFVSTPFLSPVVHWIQNSLQPDENGLLTSKQPSLVNWLAPMPPPLSGSHSYVMLLYKQSITDNQPLSRDQSYIEPQNLWKRFRWNPDAYANENSLGNAVAVAIFKV